MSEADADLMPGETVLYSWTISARTFLIRTGAILLFWIVVGQVASLAQLRTMSLLALPVAALFGLFYMWVFGELDVWPRNRNTNWHLTDRAIHTVPGDDLPSRLPLTDIRGVSRWPIWSLVVRFNAGTATVLPIPPDPKALRARILAARDHALPEAHA